MDASKTISQNLLDDGQNEKFSNLLDSAKSKYVSKDAAQLKNGESFIGAEKKTTKNTVFHDSKKQIESSNVSSNRVETNQGHQIIENNEISTVDEQTQADVEQNVTNKEAVVAVEDVEFEKRQTTSNLSADTNIKLSENILNNIILGHSSLTNNDEENSEYDIETKENIDEISNIEDTMLNVLDKLLLAEQTNNEKVTQNLDTKVDDGSQIETELVLDVKTDTTKVEKQNIDAQIAVQGQDDIKSDLKSTEKIIDKTDLAIKSNDTIDSLKQTKLSNMDNNILNIESSENMLIEDTNIQDLSNDTLVKVDDVVELAVDDLSVNTKAETKDTSKISQEVIEDLDVVVKSVVSSDKQKMHNENGQSFSNLAGNQHGNAQENIIKMSLQNASVDTTETTTFELTQVGQNLTDTTNVLSTNSNVDFNLKATTNVGLIQQPQTQQLSDNEILSQINNKLTLPQDNTVNKVNIILQPEQLGKVSVEITQTKEGIVAKLIADTAQVKDLLDKSVESLKNTLASQGVNVNNISVKVEETTASQNAGFGFEQEQFNREAANQSNQNQQKNSGNSHAFNSENNFQDEEASSNIVNEIENTETKEPEQIKDNNSGSISIMV